MGRAPCCDKASVKRGAWSPEEDDILKNYIHRHGNGGNWISLPRKAGLRRCGKSCRLRWLNYLRPDIRHGDFTEEEDNIIFTLYNTLGSRWSVIASKLPGRTDNDVKNYWNTKLKKKLLSSATIIPQSRNGAINSSSVENKAAISASFSLPQSNLHENSSVHPVNLSNFHQNYNNCSHQEMESGYFLPCGSNNHNISSQGTDQVSSTVSTSSSSANLGDFNGYGGWWSSGSAEEDEFPMNFNFEISLDDYFLEEFSLQGLIMDNI